MDKVTDFLLFLGKLLVVGLVGEYLHFGMFSENPKKRRSHNCLILVVSCSCYTSDSVFFLQIIASVLIGEILGCEGFTF